MIEVKSKTDVILAKSYDYDYSGTHMGERKVTVTIQSPTAIDFNIGDYIDLALFEHPEITERFWLQSIPIGNRVYNSLMISYTATFWWVGYELKNVVFMDYVEGFESDAAYNRNTAEVYVFATPTMLLNRIMANMNRIYPSAWSYDLNPEVPSITKDVSVENGTCYDALLQINTLFGLDWKINFSTREIVVGYSPVVVRVESVEHTFEFGKDKGLCEITRVQNDQPVITRVRAYGSTRNIPTNYRMGISGHDYSPRLCLPDPGYIDSPNIDMDNIHEGIYVNDEIYPTFTALDNTIFAVDAIIDTPIISTPQYETRIITPAYTTWETPAWKGIPYAIPEPIAEEHPAETEQVLVPQTAYSTNTFTVYIADPGFDINDENIKTTSPAKMSFTTGLLQANEFKIVSYNKFINNIGGVPLWDDGFGNKLYKIVMERNANDVNYMLPNSIIQPAIGDEYVFLDIFIPTEYIEAAELRLKSDTEAWLPLHDRTPKAYAITVTEEFVRKYSGVEYYLRESNAVTIHDDILGADETVLIQGITISFKANAILPTYSLTISDVPVKGRIDKIESGIKRINQYSSAGEYKAAQETNNNLKTATIFKESITDNNGKLKGARIQQQSVRPESLSLDLRQSDFILNAYFEINH